MYHTCNNIIIHDEETKGMTAMANLGSLWNSIQTWLFPMLEDKLGELDEKHREFVAVCELCSPQAYVKSYRWVGNGCPPASRLAGLVQSLHRQSRLGFPRHPRLDRRGAASPDTPPSVRLGNAQESTFGIDLLTGVCRFR